MTFWYFEKTYMNPMSLECVEILIIFDPGSSWADFRMFWGRYGGTQTLDSGVYAGGPGVWDPHVL